MQHLEASARGQPLGEKLPQDLAGPFVGADQRGHRKDEALRPRVEIEPTLGIVDPVGKPVRQHVEHQLGAALFGMLRIAQQTREDPVDNRLQFLGHHL